MIPGEFFIKDKDLILNEGRKTVRIKVINQGDRPIQVGSHFHFFEVNRQMSFPRELAYGMRLNIIASTAVRFEPGEEKEIELVEFVGLKKIYGHNNLVDGLLNKCGASEASIEKLVTENFKNVKP